MDQVTMWKPCFYTYISTLVYQLQRTSCVFVPKILLLTYLWSWATIKSFFRSHMNVCTNFHENRMKHLDLIKFLPFLPFQLMVLADT